jgi:hypothetical protein
LEDAARSTARSRFVCPRTGRPSGLMTLKVYYGSPGGVKKNPAEAAFGYRLSATGRRAIC